MNRFSGLNGRSGLRIKKVYELELAASRRGQMQAGPCLFLKISSAFSAGLDGGAARSGPKTVTGE